MTEYLLEEFRKLDVDNCGYRYSISNYGRVYDNINNKFVAQVLTGKPKYFYVNLTPDTPVNDNKRILRRINNLLGKVFLLNPKPEIYDRVDHIDCNRYNNTLDNLRWIDRKGNHANIDFTKKDWTIKTDDGQLVKDYCYINYPDNSYQSYQYIIKTMRLGSTFKEAINQLERRRDVDNNIHALKTINTLDGSVYLLDFLRDYCNNIETVEYFKLKNEGLSDYEISKGYRYKISVDKSVHESGIEANNMWFTSVTSLCNYYNMSYSCYCKRLKQGLSYTEAIERKTTPVYTVNGVTGTLRELSIHYNIKYSVVSDRMCKGYSIEDALLTERKRLTHYYINGKRMRKKEFLFQLLPVNISVKTFNSRQARLGLDIQQTMDSYGIDYSGYTIVPDV